jgi:hypothetical protein
MVDEHAVDALAHLEGETRGCGVAAVARPSRPLSFPPSFSPRGRSARSPRRPRRPTRPCPSRWRTGRTVRGGARRRGRRAATADTARRPQNAPPPPPLSPSPSERPSSLCARARRAPPAARPTPGRGRRWTTRGRPPPPPTRRPAWRWRAWWGRGWRRPGRRRGAGPRRGGRRAAGLPTRRARRGGRPPRAGPPPGRRLTRQCAYAGRWRASKNGRAGRGGGVGRRDCAGRSSRAAHHRALRSLGGRFPAHLPFLLLPATTRRAHGAAARLAAAGRPRGAARVRRCVVGDRAEGCGPGAGFGAVPPAPSRRRAPAARRGGSPGPLCAAPDRRLRARDAPGAARRRLGLRHAGEEAPAAV